MTSLCAWNVILLQGVVLAVLLPTANIASPSIQSSSPQIHREIQERKIAKFKLDLHRSLEGRRIRGKRDAGLLATLPNENALLDEHLLVGSTDSEQFPFLTDLNLTFWAPVQSFGRRQLLVGNHRGDLMLFDLDLPTAAPVAVSYGEDFSYKAKAFTYYSEHWFVVLQKSGNQSHLRLYLREGRGLERRQTIVLNGDSDFDVITVRGIHHLAVATQLTTTMKGFSYQASIALYHWTRTQFDLVATRVTYGARSISGWLLDGSLYLTVAQEVDDAGNFFIGSPVFVYNSKEENQLMLHEMLITKAPRKVTHFYVNGNHYVVFVGRFDAVIYWWSGNQFLIWQTIPGTAEAKDVSILYLTNGEIMIVILLHEEILFLTLDTSGHYIVTSRIDLRGLDISVIQLLYSGSGYYILLSSSEHRQHLIRKLNLVTYNLPKQMALDPLLQCLTKLRATLETQQKDTSELEPKLDKIWVTNKEQIVVANVIVAGSVGTNKLLVDDVKMTTNQMSISPWTNFKIKEDLLEVEDDKNSVEQLLNNAVFKSKDQEIYGSTFFTGGLQSSVLSIGSLSGEVFVNGVPVSRLATSTLKTSSSQTFLEPVKIKSCSVGNAIVGNLNSLDTNELLLLRNLQFVSGNLKFMDVGATGIILEYNGTLNNIQMNEYVTTTNDQNIKGLKTFRYFTSEVIDVQETTNGEDLSEIQNKMVTIADDQEINGHVEFMASMQEDLSEIRNKMVTIADDQEINGHIEFMASMQVKDDIFLNNLINDEINVTQIHSEGVMKHTQQHLSGSKVFLSPVVIYEDIILNGKTNGLNMAEEVLTVSTNQIITGDIVFSSPLKFHRTVSTNMINGIDFNKDVVNKKQEQFIEGNKKFTTSVRVNDITMTDMTTIDYTDPSEIEISIVKHENGIIKNNAAFNNVLVLGNFAALQGINGKNIWDLSNLVWLKSKEQRIETPVFFPGSIIMDSDLETDVLNGFNLDFNFVHSFGDEEILSPKTFNSEVDVVNDIGISPGTLIQGADISSYDDLDAIGDNLIHGRKTFNHLKVKGSIEVETINGLNVLKDIMMTELHQTVKGKMNLLSVMALATGHLEATSIFGRNINGIDFIKFSTDAVKQGTSVEKQIKNKSFNHMKATKSSISALGRVDGVFIPELLIRAVTLNTPQYIMVNKTFMNTITFDAAVSTTMVNDMDLINHVNKVVITDKQNVISGQKMIKGNMKTGNVSLQNLINSIDLSSLYYKAVSKTRNNTLFSMMIFENNLNIDYLAIQNHAEIDGISLDDVVLIYRNEILSEMRFKDGLQVDQNIIVHGLVNDCNLNLLESLALYTEKYQQIVKGISTFRNLKITGNVYIKKHLNKVDMNLLQQIVTKSGTQTINGNLHVYPGVVVEHLRIKNFINNINISTLILDSVKKSIPQVITGQKIFIEDLAIFKLMARDMFIFGTMNNMAINELIKETVWKNGYQIVDGEKILDQLVAKKLQLHGYLNGLKLPEDLVLTNTSEVIHGHTYFMKDLLLKSNILIQGFIDEVNLNRLFNTRITLSGEDEINSNLNFEDDVSIKGMMNVEGTINDLVLEMIVNTKYDVKLHGFKSFTTDVKIAGFLKTNSLNSINIRDLANSVTRRNAKEVLKEIQVFDIPLHVNLATVYLVNDIQISEVEINFKNASQGVIGVVAFLENINNLQQAQLMDQLEASSYQISSLAYFVIVQELDSPPSSRILLGNTRDQDTFSNIVMWTKKQECNYLYKCCDIEFSYWLHVDDGKVSVTRGPERGRYFPLIRGPSYSAMEENLVLWTNSTITNTWCTQEKEETIIGTMENGILKLTFQIINSAALTDIKTFIDGQLYLIAGYYYDKRNGDYSRTIVYSYNALTKGWKEHQLLPTYGVLSMDVTEVHKGLNKKILLVLGTGMKLQSKLYSSVYEWNENRKRFELLQNIPSRYASSVMWMNCGKDKLLAVANEKQWLEECSSELYIGEINVYRYENRLTWIQSIPLSGIISMVSFSIGGDAYIAAASGHLQTIYILQWKGYSGFKVIQTMFIQDVRHLNTYWNEKELYITVASASQSTKILKAVTRGTDFSLELESTENRSVVELHDAPLPHEEIKAQKNC